MGPSALALRPARLADAGLFASHLVRHLAESGHSGAPIFAPVPTPSHREVRESSELRWGRPLSEPVWGRAWLLCAEEGRVVGHVELRGGRIAAELHRATLGMGIERPYVGQGHGTRLLAEAIRWARVEAGLAWIDLGVFAGNEPARRLYERAGFVTLGPRVDAFRLQDGTTITDVLMALELRPCGS